MDLYSFSRKGVRMVAQALLGSESSCSAARPPKAQPKRSSKDLLLKLDFESSSKDWDLAMNSWSDNAKLGLLVRF